MKLFLTFLLLWICLGLLSKAALNPEWITNLYVVILMATQFHADPKARAEYAIRKAYQ